MTNSSTDSFSKCRKVDGLELRRAGADRGHQMLEPDLKQLGPTENRVNPLKILVAGIEAETEQFRAAADDRERSADLMNNSREQTSHLYELPVKHRQRDELPVLHQSANACQNQFRSRVLGNVIVGSGMQAGQNVAVVMPDCEHENRNATDLGVATKSTAHIQTIKVWQVHVQDDDMGTDFQGFGQGVGSPVNLEDRVAPRARIVRNSARSPALSSTIRTVPFSSMHQPSVYAINGPAAFYARLVTWPSTRIKHRVNSGRAGRFFNSSWL